MPRKRSTRAASAPRVPPVGEGDAPRDDAPEVESGPVAAPEGPRLGSEGVEDAPETPPLRPLPPEKPRRKSIDKDLKLRNARMIGKGIQRMLDTINTQALLASGFAVDFGSIPAPTIPVDYRKGRNGLELIRADLGTAIAYHGQELGLDSIERLLSLLDEHPKAVAAIGIGACIAVNALHVRSVAVEARDRHTAKPNSEASQEPEAEANPNA